MAHRMRILIPTLLTALLVGAPTASAVLADTTATAINRTDDSTESDVAFKIVRLSGGVVDNQNVAQAYASCARCRATAIAFQVVLASGAVDAVRPVNVAAAVNDNCDTCESFASAKQFVRVTSEPMKLTASGRVEIADIRRELRRLSASSLSPADLGPQVDAAAQRMREVLAAELVPLDGHDDAEVTGRRDRTAEEVGTPQSPER